MPFSRDHKTLVTGVNNYLTAMWLKVDTTIVNGYCTRRHSSSSISCVISKFTVEKWNTKKWKTVNGRNTKPGREVRWSVCDISQGANYDRGCGSNSCRCCCCTTRTPATVAIHWYDLTLMMGTCKSCGDRTVKLAVTH